MLFSSNKRWNQQPQNLTLPSQWAKNRDLSFSWSAAVPFLDAVSRTKITPVNSPTIVPRVSGARANFVKASSQYYDCGTGENVTFTGKDMTLFFRYSLSASISDNDEAGIFARDSNVGGRSFTIDIGNSVSNGVTMSGVRVYANGGGTLGTNTIFEGRFPVSGDDRAVVIVYAPSVSRAEIWIDGELVSSGVVTLAFPSATTPARIGCRAYSGYQQFQNGQIEFVHAFKRALSASDIEALFNTPWIVSDKPDRRLWIPEPSGGALSAAASGGDAASGSATLAAQVALGAIGVALSGGSAALGASVPLSAAGLDVASGSAGAGVTVRISAAGLAQAAGAAGLSVAVLLAAAGTAYASGNATLGARLQAIATGSAQASGIATLNGGALGSISAAGLAQAAGSATLAASVYLSGVGAATAGGNATLAAQLNALASGAAQAGGTATLAGGAPGALSASGSASAGGSATLKVTVQLVATGAAQAGGSANLAGGNPGALSASGASSASGSATTSVTAALSAAGFVHAIGAGQLSVQVAGGLLQPGPDRYRIKALPRHRTAQASARNRRVYAR